MSERKEYEVKGYKVFNPDWTCLGFQYEVGKTYEMDGEIEVCRRGFHFCQNISDCFDYYSFDSNNKVAEVVALGAVETDGDKSCTNKIRIVREITWQEALALVNTGQNCTGRGNSGNENSGDRNSGDWNSGDWNLTDGSSGCFNTKEQTILFFDKESDLTLREWRMTRACALLDCCELSPMIWICEGEMSDKEKAENKGWEVRGGYLKENNTKKAFEVWWSELSPEDRDEIKSIPNFDAEKFYKITGLDVEKE